MEKFALYAGLIWAVLLLVVQQIVAVVALGVGVVHANEGDWVVAALCMLVFVESFKFKFDLAGRRR